MWKPDRLLKVILIWTSITMIIVWLPMVRTVMDGATYEWSNQYLGMQFSGKGMEGDFWILPLLTAFCVMLLYLGWRGARQPFHWLLLLWNGANIVESVYNALRFPERYRFRGDTLGVDVSLAWVGPLCWGGLLALSLIWVVRDLKHRPIGQLPVWNRYNSVLLAIALGLLPIQFVLLRFGEPHGTTDQIGVILTMAQWLFLNKVFAPHPSKQSLQESVTA